MANENNGKNVKAAVGFGTMFSVASVWFGTHVGGGFATGNQSIQYFVQYGWTAAVLPLLSMGLLALTIREAMIMARSRNEYNYKALFATLWSPYPKFELTFELFFYIIAFAATGAAVAGAASLLTQIKIPYGIAVLVVGGLLMVLSIFGADLIRKASTVMSIGILISSFTMYFIGIAARNAHLTEVMTLLELPKGVGTPAWRALVYAGFQCIAIPSMVACCKPLKSKGSINGASFLGFLMNGAATAISAIMLLSWYPEIIAQGKLALPNLFVCQQLGIPALYVLYFVCLFLAFVSTSVSLIFSFTVRLENAVFKKAAASGQGAMSKLQNRRIVIAIVSLIVCMAISMVGLTNIIRYGYAYCGYLGIAFILIPFLSWGHIKNKRYIAANPGCFDKA